MPDNSLKEARKKVAFSYAHKLILLFAACAGFSALYSLGQQKDDFDKHERWAVRGPLEDTVSRVANCEGMTLPKIGYATREELIVAVQERAESCIWAQSAKETEKIQKKISSIDLSEGGLKNYDDLLDLLEKREVYTRTKLAAVRQHLNVVLRQEELTEDKFFPSIFDEKSNSHIIYQILWYGSLLFALAASALLIVVLLTALPITNGRGYWTQRISDFLDRIPATAKRTAAAPLLAATLGAGTFVGAVAETQPGGEAWRVEDRRVYITDSAEHGLTSNYEWLDVDYKEGDWVVYDQRTSPVQPPEIEWDEVTGPLREINDQIKGLKGKIDDESREIVAAINSSAQTNSGNHINLTRNIDNHFRTIKGDVQTIKETGEDTLRFFKEDLSPLLEKVNNIETIVKKHSADSEAAEGEVKTREKKQEGTSEDLLAQSAEVDPRGAFARKFLPTVYKVGPAVPRIMGERLADIPETEREKYIAALEKMPQEALRRKPFKEALLKQLVDHGLADQAEEFITNHFRSLLRVSAMPRR